MTVCSVRLARPPTLFGAFWAKRTAELATAGTVREASRVAEFGAFCAVRIANRDTDDGAFTAVRYAVCVSRETVEQELRNMVPAADGLRIFARRRPVEVRRALPDSK